MDEVRALGPLPEGVHASVEDGHLLVYVRRDMLHLDADELHDRLAAWTQRTLARELPAASAHLSFRHASPADPHEDATLDLQEAWRDLEPTLALDLAQARPGDVGRLAARVPEFLRIMEEKGRPPGFRDVETGTME